jgi:uncharacterized protein (TIGR04551 family)
LTRPSVRHAICIAEGFLLVTFLLAPSPAHAQFGGQPGGGMGPGGMQPQPQGGGEEQKEEGPAEAAPDDDTARATDLEPLGGYPSQRRKLTRIIELDGYFRVRSDFFHKLDLGQGYATTSSGALALRPPPFPLPIDCPAQATSACSYHNLGGGNTRLRLEPTINVTNSVRVHSQIDVLDNTMLGSTPDSLISATRPGDRSSKAALGALYTTQDAPEIGKNGFMSSLRAKRAWAQVDSEFGSLMFGRMPWHWGRGMVYNNGACMDCEGGTTVDRVMAMTQIYGHQLAVAWDWGAAGPSLGMTPLGRADLEGAPLDLSQEDDVFEVMASVSRLDDDRKFRDKMDLGEVAVNYGLQLVYRNQNTEVYGLADTGATAATPAMGATTTATDTPSRDDLANPMNRRTRNIYSLQPDAWFKLGYKLLTLELEVSALLGSAADGGPLVEDTSPRNLTLKQLGWVAASEIRLAHNALSLGFETGGATGDSAENVNSYLNYRWKLVTQPPGDHKLTDFKFNPDYQIDQILFRRLLGTVTNALYIKPSVTYWLDLAEGRQLGLSGALLYSMALVPVSTPGNSLSYGVEANLGVTYRNPGDGFFGGVTYGVLWPMGALDRGRNPSGASTTGGFTVTDDAETAQVLRAFLGIKF